MLGGIVSPFRKEGSTMDLYEVYYKVGLFKKNMYRIFGTSENNARETFLKFFPDKTITKIVKA